MFILFLKCDCSKGGARKPIRRFHHQRPTRLLNPEPIQASQVELLRSIPIAGQPRNGAHKIVRTMQPTRLYLRHVQSTRPLVPVRLRKRREVSQLLGMLSPSLLQVARDLSSMSPEEIES